MAQMQMSLLHSSINSSESKVLESRHHVRWILIFSISRQAVSIGFLIITKLDKLRPTVLSVLFF